MGLIKAAMGAAGSVMADQWKEYFYCEALPVDVLAVRGRKKVSGRSSNKGGDNVISNGSLIAVADGQCMLIVDQGKIVDVCAEPGEYTYDMSTEPSVFTGSLGAGISVDERAGIDLDIGIRCFGAYSYRITNPLLFYTNVCGNVSEDYTRDKIDDQLKSELLTALQPAFARVGETGVRYSGLTAHTKEISKALNDELSAEWKDVRGLEIVSFGVSSVKASEEDEQMIKEMQREAAYMDPTRAAGALSRAQAQAMTAAASNTSAGPAMAFMGMGMAQQAGGINAQSLYAMGQQQQMAAQQAAANAAAPKMEAPAGGWKCSCGAVNTGKFCAECGQPKPVDDTWTCSCGAVNKGRFCSECGKPKPAAVKQYKCNKCGWVPEDPTNPPKFCPECGDPFDAGDVQN